MEQIKRFMEKVQMDEALQAAIKELSRHEAGLDEVIALAEEHGFSFTKEDWETAAKEAAAAGELSEEQLAAVSGGGMLNLTKRLYFYNKPTPTNPPANPATRGVPTHD